MKKPVCFSMIALTVLFFVFIAGFMIGRSSGSAIPMANVSHLVPTEPFLPEDLPGKEVIGNKININAASVETLSLLPGISYATAQKIYDYREENGPFEHIEELRLIDGLGAKRFNNLSKYVTVGD